MAGLFLCVQKVQEKCFVVLYIDVSVGLFAYLSFIYLFFLARAQAESRHCPPTIPLSPVATAVSVAWVYCT